MIFAPRDAVAGRRSLVLSYVCAVGAAGAILGAGQLGFPAAAVAQTTLPPLQVETTKAKPKAARQKKAATAKSVPQKAPTTVKAETGTSHVDGYDAKVSATGTKTDTPLLLTPQSISVVTSDQIKDQGVQSVGDALRYTPGISVELNGGTSRFDELRIRGFTPVQYLDGMPVPLNQFFATPLIGTYGLERIEALRGPASFLFGQNSPGGLLNMISKRPTEEILNELQLQYGSNDFFQTAFDFSGPAGKDGKLLYRLTGTVRDADTVVDYTRDNVFSIAPAFTWRPSAGTSLTVLASYGFDNGTFPHQYVPAEGSLLDNPNGRIPLSRFLGEPGWDTFNREQWAVGYIFEHRLNDVWKFQQSLRYSAVDTFFRAYRVEGLEADKATVDRGAYAVDADAGIFTIDNQLQARISTGWLRHQLLFGVDYLHQSGDYTFSGALPKSFGGTVDPINVYNPVYGAITPPLDVFQSNHTDQSQLGVYVQDQVKFGNWLLTIGGRQDWVENSTDDHLAGATVSRDDSAFTGRAGLTYVFPSGIAPYISYATSFQPTAGVDGLGQPFKPTTGEQYEAGIKYQPPGGNLYIAAAVFDITQQNAVTYDPVTFIGSQTGEIRVRGFDIEGKWTVNANLSLLASYAYLDSEVTESSNPFEVGRVVPLVPMHKASLWARYGFTEGPMRGLWLGAGVRYTGETLGENSSAEPLKIPGYTLYDAAIGYDLGQLDKSLKGTELTVNVTNLFDKYHVAGYCDVTYCSLGEGRTIMTTLRFRW